MKGMTLMKKRIFPVVAIESGIDDRLINDCRIGRRYHGTPGRAPWWARESSMAISIPIAIAAV